VARSKLNSIKIRLKDLETEKNPWLPLLQAVAEVFLVRNADFTRASSPAEFIQDLIFNNTPQFAAYTSASVFLSMLWPDSSRTFRLKPVSQLKDMPGVEAYFRSSTEEMHEKMDKPEAGLQLALMGHFLDVLVFGISGVGTFEGEEDDAEMPVTFETWDAKSMYVSENKQGFIDAIFIKLNWTVRQIMEEYGSGKNGDRVSAHVRKRFEEKKFDERVEILKVIEPKKPEKGKRGVAAMKVSSTHIDLDNNIIMRESGFEEMPVAVGRLFKWAKEMQGRSSGMIALPAANSLNALDEAILVASEKQLDPPLMVSDDARLGGGVIDTSASAVNVVMVR